MSDLVFDVTTVRRAQRVIGSFVATRTQTIADRPGNPLGAEIRRYDGALATRIPPFGQHRFNRAFGFSDESLAAAEAVVDWYAEAGVAGAFEISPGLETDRLLSLLHRRDYRHTSFHATLVARPALPHIDAPGVEVRRVTDAAGLRAFADAYHLGWSHAGVRVPMEPWLSAPGWCLYLGLCDGEPAGAALLYVEGDDAYLADSAVDPRYRGRGVHRALLDRRCADAAASDCELVFAGAGYISTSLRNMLRKGLGVLCTNAIWTAGA
jgi:ribosomal protein S18 acetylase RimI-like enzyme